MEKEMPVSSRGEIYTGRVALVLASIVIFAITYLELKVLFDLEFRRIWIRAAMWVGTLFYLFSAVVVLVTKLKDKKNEYSRYGLPLVVVMGVVSVVGFYIPTHVELSLTVNAVWCFTLSIAVVCMFLKLWKECAYTETTEP